MTEKQAKKERDILERAIQKAINGGWQPLEGIDAKTATFEFNEETTRIIWRYKRVTALEEASVYGVIFNHNFAKALWGESWANFTEGQSGDMFSLQAPNWKGHLMNMVISVNPINYLGKNI